MNDGSTDLKKFNNI